MGLLQELRTELQHGKAASPSASKEVDLEAAGAKRNDSAEDHEAGPRGKGLVGAVIGGKNQERVLAHANPIMVFKRFVDLAFMANAEKRHREAFRVAAAWAWAIIALGCVFVPLCATGTFPSSVESMKAADLFSWYLARYSLYIVAGAFGFAGTICLYKGLKLNSPRLLSWGKVLYWASYATILATIAILIYALTRISELKAAGADIQWWQYLVFGVALAMRLLLFIALMVAQYATYEAESDDSVRQSLVQGGW